MLQVLDDQKGRSGRTEVSIYSQTGEPLYAVEDEGDPRSQAPEMHVLPIQTWSEKPEAGAYGMPDFPQE